jgi:hypothetical protein
MLALYIDSHPSENALSDSIAGAFSDAVSEPVLGPEISNRTVFDAGDTRDENLKSSARRYLSN